MATKVRSEFDFGEWKVWITDNMIDCVIFTLPYDPTQEQVDELWSKHSEINEYKEIHSAKFNLIEDGENIIKEFIKLIKENPNVTLNQYNIWLSKQSWFNESIIRYFVFALALELSKRFGVTLQDISEGQVLLHVRDWIVETPIKKIRKVIFNTIFE